MRVTDPKRLEEIWRTVEENPGMKAGRVARELKLGRSSVARALPQMEAQGLLLSEDGRGGLWSWGRQDKK